MSRAIAPGHEKRLAALDWRKAADGLLPAVVQHAQTGEMLMLGYMSEASLAQTLSSGRVTFYSRSRRTLWTKGETSGHFLEFEDVRADCDADTLLIRALPQGPVCHLGTRTCFDLAPGAGEVSMPPGASAPGAQLTDAAAGSASSTATPSDVMATLQALEATIAQRARDLADGLRDGESDGSYVARLLAKGPRKAAQKVGEEGVEVALAVVDEDDEALIGEAADLLFHLLVALRSRDLGLADVARELARRQR